MNLFQTSTNFNGQLQCCGIWGVRLHPVANSFWAKLVRFGKVWLDLGENDAKLRRNLGKTKAKIGQK